MNNITEHVIDLINYHKKKNDEYMSIELKNEEIEELEEIPKEIGELMETRDWFKVGYKTLKFKIN